MEAGSVAQSICRHWPVGTYAGIALFQSQLLRKALWRDCWVDPAFVARTGNASPTLRPKALNLDVPPKPEPNLHPAQATNAGPKPHAAREL